MDEKVDDDDNGNMVAMLPHLPCCHYCHYHVVNRFGGMGKVMGRTSESGGELGKVMTRKRVHSGCTAMFFTLSSLSL